MILVLSQINLAIENLRIYKEFYELEPSIKCQYNSYFFLSKSQIFLEKTITILLTSSNNQISEFWIPNILFTCLIKQ